MTISRTIRILFCVTILSFNAHSAASESQANPEILGQKILSVQQAIANPDLPGSMPAVHELGHDSRYYVMVRGWLSEELRGSRSIADAMGNDVTSELKRKIQFLEKAIRTIDLE